MPDMVGALDQQTSEIGVAGMGDAELRLRAVLSGHGSESAVVHGT